MLPWMAQHGLALATHLVFHLRRTIHEKGGLSEVPPSYPEPNSATGHAHNL